MIVFHKLTLEDKDWMEQRYAEDNRRNCENSFANNYMWRHIYHVEVAQVQGLAVLRFTHGGEICFSYPVGKGDKKRAIESLLAYCKEEHLKLQLSPLSEEDRADLMTWFPGKFLIQADRGTFDYIYTVDKLTTLAGKKLHGKRNHIARFKDGDDWSYEPLTEENIPSCKKMTKEWIQMREEKWNTEMEQEMSVLYEAFDHFKELGLAGGVLRKAGEIVAFCVGEPLNEDTFVVHFEKAFPELQGAYPMINQQFVMHTCQDYKYVNREEDTGDLGLRRAKLSYYPDILLTKYAARVSDVVFADAEKDRDGILQLWSSCFGDEEEYIDFYLQKRMTKDNMLVIYQDGKLVSMASFLPASYVLADGTVTNARYVYAVATLPEYRGKGYAGRLLDFGKKLWQEMLVLTPATESLHGYYKRMGFEEAFMQEQTPDMEIQPSLEDEREYYFKEVSAAEYLTIRNQAFQKPGSLLWDEQAIQYAMDSNAYFGGKTVVVIKDQDEGREDDDKTCSQAILMYYIMEGTLVVVETTLQPDCMKRILPELMAENHADKVVIKQYSGMLLPNGSMTTEDIVTTGYINLILE